MLPSVLLLGVTLEGTGNLTTMMRVAKYLQGQNVVIMENALQFDKHALKNIDAVIALHAHHAGKHLYDVQVPYALIFGGTDLNEDVHDEKKFATICSAVANAAELVAFNDDFLQRAKILFPQHVHKLVCIPQSVAVSPCADFSFRTSFGLNNDHIVIALIGGIRPVKDTLFLAQEMDAWHKQDCRIKFVLVGPFRDDAYQSQVQLALTKYQDSLLHVPCLSMEQCHRAMQECNIIVNTSKSECLPNALLEAMSLSVPVFARNIPGNSMVQHMVTGVQFATPSEFVTLAKQVLDNAELRAQLTANAKLYIEKHHSPQYECSQYQALVKRLGNAKTC